MCIVFFCCGGFLVWWRDDRATCRWGGQIILNCSVEVNEKECVEDV